MKINDNFVLQKIADEFIVVPIGKEADRLHGVFSLNITGAFLWKLLSQEEHSIGELVHALIEAFSIDKVTAQKDAESFIQKLNSFGCLNE